MTYSLRKVKRVKVFVPGLDMPIYFVSTDDSKVSIMVKDGVATIIDEFEGVRSEIVYINCSIEILEKETPVDEQL